MRLSPSGQGGCYTEQASLNVLLLRHELRSRIEDLCRSAPNHASILRVARGAGFPEPFVLNQEA